MRPSRLLPAVAALLLGLLLPPATADERLPGPVPARVMAVIDGDTLVVKARIWLGQAVETRVRLADIDTPALRASCDSARLLAVRATWQNLLRVTSHEILNSLAPVSSCAQTAKTLVDSAIDCQRRVGTLLFFVKQGGEHCIFPLRVLRIISHEPKD